MITRNSLRGCLSNNRAFVLASESRWSLGRCWRDLNRRTQERAVVSLRTDQPSRGTVLLSYIIEPFLNTEASVSSSHTNYWESRQMAQTLLNIGYDVDVISYRNDVFHPLKPYTAVIDLRHNMQRLAPLLHPACVKLFHIDVAHILFHNAAEASRLLALQQRRGVTLPPRRFERPNLGIEHADCATTLGNEFTIRTYRYARRPIHRLPIPCAFTHPWMERNFDRCRNNFLFFSSGGLVHKGLDLALEAFAGLPDYHLTVCAPIDAEPEFQSAFRKELYGLPNIHTVGWVGVDTPAFTEIARRCLAVLSPSCSEGGGGASITCMHAGLIPIVSYESSVDVGGFGFLLKECSVAEIRETIEYVAAMPACQLESRARMAWEHARAHHTREQYAERYHEVMSGILQTA